MSDLAFKSLMVANRGEIAARVLRTGRQLGLRTLLVAHPIDGVTPAHALADDIRYIDGLTPVAAFLDQAQVLRAACDMGAEAIHPGYGFLSENAAFARAVEAASITWVGPSPDSIELMGDKIRARAFVSANGFPVAPSAIEDDDPATFAERVRALGPPLLLKPSAGGGGKGMRIVRHLSTLESELERARSEALRYFGDARLYAERYVEQPRHIEVQVMGDAHGNVVHLFERECSLQRRFQKVIEEAPSPSLSNSERTAITGAAAGIARACGYRGAGTVEFIYGGGEFWFLEMNTRLQVEHPVTEMITGLDLVALQLSVASGSPLPFRQKDIRCKGHAFEARLYAEAPARDFAPTTGRLLRLSPPEGPNIRFDAGVVEGEDVSSAFDPMLAKLIVSGANRNEALDTLVEALAQTIVFGIETNCGFLRRLANDPAVRAGRMHTGLIAEKIELLASPASDSQTHDVLIGAALSALPELRAELDRTPDLHATIGAWRN